MSDLRRLGGVAAAVAFLAACLASCEAALAATSPWWPAWLKYDWGCIEFPASQAIGPRIAGVVKAGPAQDRSIGVLLGSSYQWTDIDLPMLEAEVRPTRKWLRLTVHGGSTCEVDRIARLLLIDGQVKPATVVITVGAKMLAHAENYRNAGMTDLVEWDIGGMVSHPSTIRPLDVARVARALLVNGFNTAFPERIKINYRLNSRLVRLRLAMLGSCAQGIDAVFAPTPNPWAEDMPPFVLQTPEQVAKHTEEERQEGRFDPALFSPLRESSRSLIEMIRLARSVGAEPIVVIMPERSIYRAALPPNARRTLFATLFGAAARVIDLETFAPDGEFLDLHHLGERGKARVTRRLIEELNGDTHSPPAESRGRLVASSGDIPESPPTRGASESQLCMRRDR
jgi:hypothetical protein